VYSEEKVCRFDKKISAKLIFRCNLRKNEELDLDVLNGTAQERSDVVTIKCAKNKLRNTCA
jgi:hypothetical protein